MTFQDLYELEVRDRLDDPDTATADNTASKWTDAVIKRAINRIYREMCMKGKLLRTHLTFIANGASTANYVTATTAEIGEIEWVGSATYRSRFQHVSFAELMDTDSAWATTTGTPYLYVFGDYTIQTSRATTNTGGEQILRLYPDPGTALTDVAGVVIEVPIPLSATTDEPRLPSDLHDALADGVAAYLYSQMGQHADPQAAAYWMGMYQAGLQAAADRSMRQGQTGGVSIAPSFF